MATTLARIVCLGGLLAAARSTAGPAVEIGGDRIVVNHRAAISTDLLFGVGEWVLTAPGKELLDGVAALLVKEPSAQISVNCYTDTTAPDNDRTGVYLAKLSRERATAVVAYLAKKGVAAKRMTAQGFGAEDPAGDNATDDGKAENRRIEIAIANTIATEVRPPLASDLAGYTKNVRGRGVLTATINTNRGALHCELFERVTPATVANFVGLATGQKPWLDPHTNKVTRGRPFYDGLTFHRVIPGFMIQGGDPLGTGTGGPGYQFHDELAPDLHHEPGTLAMANAGPNTNGSQFFIDEVEATWLDNHHTIFGQCNEVETIAAIAKVPRDSADKPTQPVVIRSISFARVEP
jgi:peptidyl-prolyl cis-trans isomerase A (cyclophilin A)